ncbi:ATP-dependent RNA helicase DHX8 [Penicillium macrosclerotiorum]|uniref:ATP-dependent RNA helicase DHX8 n=1 Tax=Penicillium macrosclerotiorum TaxID=303699 RepID=UPI002548775C|nr:ATP-dependent RNA helicase DHX8 [Penicillium macrosclerotiorum]KAJ5690009.1 ATP-dependent RNA helicase DHX8 [Penicillium macrosclerotiorum]
MQSWAARGSRAISGAARSLIQPERYFTTTPALYRSKRTQKAKEVKAAKGTKHGEGAGHTIAKPLSPKGSSRVATRQGVAAAQDFSRLVEAAVRDVQHKLHSTGESMDGWGRFERQVLNACRAGDAKVGEKFGPLRQLKLSLQKAYLRYGVQGLRDELEYMLFADNLTAKYSTPMLEAQRMVADCRYPAEWYPRARSMQRTIHLHVGPTNSGKTYHALKRLEASKSGFYAGPLRLLAQEVYHRFKDQGVSVSLVTGDDIKVPESGQVPRVVSNTVEMVNLSQEFDVGVIDEIQMIADPKRGWAWTRAVLGSQAKELHLCGETRAVPLIREICALTGDNLEIHRYNRLNPLEVMTHSLRGNLKNLQRGDCLVAFSRVGIHALKADIEKVTGRRAAIVYGGLPAEIRTQQASLFNDPDNDYDFLVASDAIGMGLNFCKRIIFETLIKRTPSGLQRLSVSEIKQIGGRAGRYRPAGAKAGPDDGTNVGLVTCLEEVDLPYIAEAMSLEPPPIRAAGLWPPDFMFQKLAGYFPRGVPFEYLIKRLMELAQVNPLFFLCDAESQMKNAEIIDTVNGLRTQDQLTLMAAPMESKDPSSRSATGAFADCVADNTRGRLLDIPDLNLEILEKPVSGNKDYMHQLESLHKAIILYSWLSFRFGGIFTDRTLAAHVKELVEERMVRALTEFSANKKLRKDASLKRQIALQKQILDQQRIISDEDLISPHSEESNIQVNLSREDPVSSSGRDPSDEPLEEGSAEAPEDDLTEDNFPDASPPRPETTSTNTG